MYSDTSNVDIGNKKYNRGNLCVLLGLEDTSQLSDHIKNNTISEDLLKIAWVLDKPVRLPMILKDIFYISRENNEDVRLALARAQINGHLKMNENLEKYMQQQFAAETMERLIFGELMLDGKANRQPRKKETSPEQSKKTVPAAKKKEKKKPAKGTGRSKKKGEK